MLRVFLRSCPLVLLAFAACSNIAGLLSTADAAQGWQGTRRVSYQAQNDLFYNYYVGPGPSGTTAQLYESPLPTPPFVGHTWITYQPFMPHEYLWRHQRSYYTYNPGAGWTRTNVRYGTGLGWGREFRRQGVPYSGYLRTFNGMARGLPR